MELIKVWGDIDNIIDQGGYQQLSDSTSFGSVIASSILNYIDWRKFLEINGDTQNKGDRIFISNLIKRGIRPLFSGSEPKTADDIPKYLERLGYDILECHDNRIRSIVAAEKA